MNQFAVLLLSAAAVALAPVTHGSMRVDQSTQTGHRRHLQPKDDTTTNTLGGLQFTSRAAGGATRPSRPPMVGTLTAMMVRVTDKNGRGPVYNSSTLHDELFGELSLGTQMAACSHDQLDIEPYQGTLPSGVQVTNGIVELTDSNLDSMNSTYKSMKSDLWDAANAAFGGEDFKLEFDLLLFCLPSVGGWIAFANGRNSWYNGKACTSTKAQMHEIGHNLGFGHSGVEGNEYGDRVGVMGSMDSQDRTCFNPHKNFFLPWYTDQNNSTKPLDGNGTRDFLLNGVANYGDDPLATISLRLQTPSSQPYDYYVGFNRKSGVNAGSLTDPNMVTVVRAEKDSTQISIKIASLVPGSAYEIEDFDGIGNSATVLFLALTDGKDAIVRIFDGPLPPANAFDNCTTNLADLIPLTVLINTDNYPEDVSWSIRDAVTGAGVGSGGNYQEKGVGYEETVCISKSSIDKIYTFIINDNYGDGLCCQQVGSIDPTFKPGFKVTNAGTVYVDKLGVELQYGLENDPNPGDNPKDPFTYNITIAGAPTEAPTEAPTQDLTEAPTQNPTEAPTQNPTEAPNQDPTKAPTQDPTEAPTQNPTEASTQDPTEAPAQNPTEAPTQNPTEAPTQDPTEAPTKNPTEAPTKDPTEAPTKNPTEAPTKDPTEAPTKNPTEAPTKEPTQDPTEAPTKEPTQAPTVPTDAPTQAPTKLACFKGCNGNNPKGCDWVGKNPKKLEKRCKKKAKNMGQPKPRAEDLCSVCKNAI